MMLSSKLLSVLLALLGVAVPCGAVFQATPAKQSPKVKTSPVKPVKPAKLQRPLVSITTSKGTISFELFPSEAPRNVANVVNLIQRGFYKGLLFHRIEDWVAQGGDPAGDGSGGPGYTVDNEANRALKHVKGAVGIANAGRNTGGSQFYILKKDAPQLDTGNYTLVGILISGMDVVEKLSAGDSMTDVTVQLPSGYKSRAVGNSHAAEVVQRAYAILPDDIAEKTLVENIDVEVSVAITGLATVKLKRGTGVKSVDDAVLSAMSEWVWTAAVKDGSPYPTVNKYQVDIFSMIRKRLP